MVVVVLRLRQGHAHAGVAGHAKKKFCAGRLSTTILKVLATCAWALEQSTMAAASATISAWRDNLVR